MESQFQIVVSVEDKQLDAVVTKFIELSRNIDDVIRKFVSFGRESVTTFKVVGEAVTSVTRKIVGQRQALDTLIKRYEKLIQISTQMSAIPTPVISSTKSKTEKMSSETPITGDSWKRILNINAMYPHQDAPFGKDVLQRLFPGQQVRNLKSNEMVSGGFQIKTQGGQTIHMPYATDKFFKAYDHDPDYVQGFAGGLGPGHSLSAINPRLKGEWGTPFHELSHNFQRSFLTQQEKNAVYIRAAQMTKTGQLVPHLEMFKSTKPIGGYSLSEWNEKRSSELGADLLGSKFAEILTTPKLHKYYTQTNKLKDPVERILQQIMTGEMYKRPSTDPSYWQTLSTRQMEALSHISPIDEMRSKTPIKRRWPQAGDLQQITYSKAKEEAIGAEYNNRTARVEHVAYGAAGPKNALVTLQGGKQMVVPVSNLRDRQDQVADPAAISKKIQAAWAKSTEIEGQIYQMRNPAIKDTSLENDYKKMRRMTGGLNSILDKMDEGGIAEAIKEWESKQDLVQKALKKYGSKYGSQVDLMESEKPIRDPSWYTATGGRVNPAGPSRKQPHADDAYTIYRPKELVQAEHAYSTLGMQHRYADPQSELFKTQENAILSLDEAIRQMKTKKGFGQEALVGHGMEQWKDTKSEVYDVISKGIMHAERRVASDVEAAQGDATNALLKSRRVLGSMPAGAPDADRKALAQQASSLEQLQAEMKSKIDKTRLDALNTWEKRSAQVYETIGGYEKKYTKGIVDSNAIALANIDTLKKKADQALRQMPQKDRETSTYQKVLSAKTGLSSMEAELRAGGDRELPLANYTKGIKTYEDAIGKAEAVLARKYIPTNSKAISKLDELNKKLNENLFYIEKGSKAYEDNIAVQSKLYQMKERLLDPRNKSEQQTAITDFNKQYKQMSSIVDTTSKEIRGHLDKGMIQAFGEVNAAIKTVNRSLGVLPSGSDHYKKQVATLGELLNIQKKLGGKDLGLRKEAFAEWGANSTRLFESVTVGADKAQSKVHGFFSKFAQGGMIMSGIAATMFVWQKIVQWIMMAVNAVAQYDKAMGAMEIGSGMNMAGEKSQNLFRRKIGDAMSGTGSDFKATQEAFAALNAQLNNPQKALEQLPAVLKVMKTGVVDVNEAVEIVVNNAWGLRDAFMAASAHLEKGFDESLAKLGVSWDQFLVRWNKRFMKSGFAHWLADSLRDETIDEEIKKRKKQIIDLKEQIFDQEAAKDNGQRQALPGLYNDEKIAQLQKHLSRATGELSDLTGEAQSGAEAIGNMADKAKELANQMTRLRGPKELEAMWGDVWKNFGIIGSGAVPKYTSTTPGINFKSTADMPTKYDEWFQKYGNESNVSPDLLKAMAYEESRFDPNAKSKADAVGLMQFIPKTAKGYGLEDRTDPEQSIKAAAKLMADLMRQFNNDVELALSAYNAGPKKVIDAGYKVPVNGETEFYVPKVLSHGTISRIDPDANKPSTITHDFEDPSTRLMAAVDDIIKRQYKARLSEIEKWTGAPGMTEEIQELARQQAKSMMELGYQKPATDMAALAFQQTGRYDPYLVQQQQKQAASIYQYAPKEYISDTQRAEMEKVTKFTTEQANLKPTMDAWKDVYDQLGKMDAEYYENEKKKIEYNAWFRARFVGKDFAQQMENQEKISLAWQKAIAEEIGITPVQEKQLEEIFQKTGYMSEKLYRAQLMRAEKTGSQYAQQTGDIRGGEMIAGYRKAEIQKAELKSQAGLQDEWFKKVGTMTKYYYDLRAQMIEADYNRQHAAAKGELEQAMALEMKRQELFDLQMERDKAMVDSWKKIHDEMGITSEQFVIARGRQLQEEVRRMVDLYNIPQDVAQKYRTVVTLRQKQENVNVSKRPYEEMASQGAYSMTLYNKEMEVAKLKMQEWIALTKEEKLALEAFQNVAMKNKAVMLQQSNDMIDGVNAALYELAADQEKYAKRISQIYVNLANSISGQFNDAYYNVMEAVLTGDKISDVLKNAGSTLAKTLLRSFTDTMSESIKQPIMDYFKKTMTDTLGNNGSGVENLLEPIKKLFGFTGQPSSDTEPSETRFSKRWTMYQDSKEPSETRFLDIFKSAGESLFNGEKNLKVGMITAGVIMVSGGQADAGGGGGFLDKLISGMFGSGSTGMGTNTDFGANTMSGYMGLVKHGGGLVDGSGPTRFMSSGLVQGAVRLHDGLAADEFPAILQRGERVIKKGDTPSDSSGITVNVNNYTGQKVETKESRGPGGTRQLEVMIGAALTRDGVASRAMKQTYGITRRGSMRG